MKKIIIVLIIVAAVGLGIFIIEKPKNTPTQTTSRAQSQETTRPSPSPTALPTPPPSPTPPNPTPLPPTPVPTPSPTPTPSLKTFTVTGHNFAFSPTEIRVSKGDTVKISFESTGGFHDWILEGYNVGTNAVNTGSASSIQFVADKVGTFEFYCNVDGHRELGMTGKLIVE